MNKKHWADPLKSYPNERDYMSTAHHPSEEDYMTTALIENAGHVGPVFDERIQWKDAVDRVQRIINLHCDNILSEGGRSREAHDKVSEIQAHWARILQG